MVPPAATTGPIMTASETPQPNAAHIVLPPILDLTRADALLGALQKGMEQDSGLSIDGSNVQVVSTACLQVLTAACLTARARNRGFTLTAPAPALRAALCDLGLDAALGLSAA